MSLIVTRACVALILYIETGVLVPIPKTQNMQSFHEPWICAQYAFWVFMTRIGSYITNMRENDPLIITSFWHITTIDSMLQH